VTEQRELVLRQELTPTTWEMITSVAPAMHASELFGVKTPAQAMAIMLKGYELGLSLSASFEFIHVVEGKPGLNPRGALALINGNPELAGLKIEDLSDADGHPSSCRVWMKRRNGFEYTVEFSIADAKRAGLVKDRSGWAKYPANMLRWRAVGFCADVVFPDVLGGMKRTDELGGDLTPEGDTIEGSWETVPGWQPATKGEAGDPNQDPEPKPNNDAAKTEPKGKMGRGELIYNIKKSNDRLDTPDEIDPTWLKEATEGELTAYGMQLRKRVDAEQVPDDMQGVE